MEEVKVLIVTDCQFDFAKGSLGTAEAVATIPAIVKKIEDAEADGSIIIATMDTHEDDYLETPEGKALPVKHCIRGTEGWQLVPEIRKFMAYHDTITVLKDRFGSTDLPAVIRTAANMTGISIPGLEAALEITLVGWCTDICVISNAILLKTAFPAARIIVDSACCAGVTKELHEAALKVMKSCQIEVV